MGKNFLRTIIILLIASISFTAFITPPVMSTWMVGPVYEALQFIGSEPRPVESQHLRATEAFIVERLENAGLPVQVLEHHTTRSSQGNVTIRNIFAEIPGTSGKSVLFIAHYDSVLQGPGAMDNAAAVSTLLEVFIISAGQLQHPEVGIQVLFTDGHEIGLGAHEFVRYHFDLVENTIFAFNFDGMGNGPLMPLQGGLRHSAMLFEAMGRPVGFSLLGYGAALDEWHFAQAGIPAMGVMSLIRPWHYHSPSDTLSNLSASTVEVYIDTIYSLMGLASQGGWVEGFTPRDTTFFMLAYGLLISYGPVVRWILAGLMLAGILTMIFYRRSGSPYVPFSQGKWDVSVRGIIFSLIGLLLFIVLFVGGTMLFMMLAANIWRGFVRYHTNIVLTSVVIVAVLVPLAYFYLKLLVGIGSWDSFGLVLSVLLGVAGVAAAVLAPGLEYFLLICAGLIALRVSIPHNRVVYYFTGIAAGILFLPLIFILLTQLGVASFFTGGILALFIPVFYALTKDYPASF